MTVTHSEETEEQLHFLIDKLIEGCQSMNIKKAFDIFSDSPDFLMMGTDGTLCDYQTYLKNNVEYFNTCKSFSLVTFERKVRIIDEKTAVYSWAYAVRAEQKDGEIHIIKKAGASFLFHKKDNTWKVVYYHESSNPVETFHE